VLLGNMSYSRGEQVSWFVLCASVAWIAKCLFFVKFHVDRNGQDSQTLVVFLSK
jgi:hypothetical protein